jgi:hypothetical protein
LHPGFDLFVALRDQFLDLARGVRGARGQCPHLGRDDRKAAAIFPGARSLDPRIQGKKVGLKGDFVDDVGDRDLSLGVRCFKGPKSDFPYPKW